MKRLAAISRKPSALGAGARLQMVHCASRAGESTRGPWTRLTRILTRPADSSRRWSMASRIDARIPYELDF